MTNKGTKTYYFDKEPSTKIEENVPKVDSSSVISGIPKEKSWFEKIKPLGSLVKDIAVGIGGEYKKAFTEKSLPGTGKEFTKELGTIAIDIPRYALRGVTSIGMELFGEEEYIPKTSVEKAIYKDEKLKSFSKNVEGIKDFLVKTTDFTNNDSTPTILAFGLAVGSLWADVDMGFTSSTKKALTKKLLKEMEEKTGKKVSNKVVNEIASKVENASKIKDKVKRKSVVESILKDYSVKNIGEQTIESTAKNIRNTVRDAVVSGGIVPSEKEVTKQISDIVSINKSIKKRSDDIIPNIKKVSKESSEQIGKKIQPRDNNFKNVADEIKINNEAKKIKNKLDTKTFEQIKDQVIKTTKDIKTTRKVDSIINLKNYNLNDTQKQYIKDVEKRIKPELAVSKSFKLDEVQDMAAKSEVLKQSISVDDTKELAGKFKATQNRLAGLIKEATEGNATKETYKEIEETLLNVKNFSTHVARLLVAHKTVTTPEFVKVKDNLIQQMILLGNKTEDVLKASRKVDWDNADSVTSFYRKFIKPTIPEIIDEYRYINLLSSPRTHLINAFSNLLQTVFLAPATRLVSGTIDSIASGLTGKARKVYVSEVPAYYRGAFNALGEASSDAMKVLSGKSMLSRPDLATLAAKGEYKIPTGNKYLKMFQTVPRALEAGDVFFRTLIKKGEKEASILNLIKDGKIKNADNIPKELLDNISKRANETATYFVFRKAIDPSNKSGQGIVLSAIDKMTNAIYSARKVPGIKWFIPFVQTPMNILKQGVEYSPLGVVTTWGAKKKTEQIAKSFIGSFVFLSAGYMAMSGNSTWSAPTNSKEKEIYYASGRKPYSVKIGDKWVSYSKLGPLAYPIAMAAALKWYGDEDPSSVTESSGKRVANAILGMSNFVSDQSYLSGLSDLLDATKGDYYAVKGALTNATSQLLPLSSLQRWVTQIIDPVYRKPNNEEFFESIGQSMIKDTPFLSKQLEGYKTPSGEYSKREGDNLYSRALHNLSPIDITSSDKEYEKMLKSYRDMQKIKKKSSKETKDFTELAKSEFERLKSLSSEESAKEFSEIFKNDINLAKKISDLTKQEKLDLSITDTMLKSLNVKNWDRAKYITEKYKTLDTKKERVNYWNELVRKKLITKEVAKQITYLLKQKYVDEQVKKNEFQSKGNIDIYNRPTVKNSDGSISTIRSISFNEDNKEILIPTVISNKIVSDKEAIDYYHKTGEYLGKFDTIKEANKYAEELHIQQQKLYNNK